MRQAIDDCVGADRDAPILNTTIAALRRTLRQRLGLRAPVIVTGHQAEFFHAGVFAKTIATGALAAQTGGAAVFLTVDSDTPKRDEIAFPTRDGDGWRRAQQKIPACAPDVALEAQPAAPRADWEALFAALRAAAPPDSLIDPFVAGFLHEPAARETALPGGIERGQRAVEQALGLSSCAPLRISALSATPEFRAFVVHLAQNARALASAYGAALANYRRRRRVRAVGRPVPPLLIEGDRIELPLWLLDRDGRRRRMFVARRANLIEVWAHDSPAGEFDALTSTPAAADAALARIESAGWRVRPRALALSGFARLMLADLFIHGIGGAKYDEITDSFMRVFIAAPLAPLACVTATLQLGTPASPPAAAEQVRAAIRRVRDLQHNPQRYLHDAPGELLQRREKCIAEVVRLRLENRKDRAARRAAHQQLRRVNEQLVATRPQTRAELEALARHAQQAEQALRVALDREYFFALHSRAALLELVRRIRAGLR